MNINESLGQKTVKVTTSAANTLIFAGPGRLNAVLVNGTGLGGGNAIIFYDAATATNTGTILAGLGANTAAWTFAAYDIPCALGISVNDAAAASNVITVVYSQTTTTPGA